MTGADLTLCCVPHPLRHLQVKGTGVANTCPIIDGVSSDFKVRQ